jgi:hypothetical protein
MKDSHPTECGNQIIKCKFYQIDLTQKQLENIHLNAQ